MDSSSSSNTEAFSGGDFLSGAGQYFLYNTVELLHNNPFIKLFIVALSCYFMAKALSIFSQIPFLHIVSTCITIGVQITTFCESIYINHYNVFLMSFGITLAVFFWTRKYDEDDDDDDEDSFSNKAFIALCIEILTFDCYSILQILYRVLVLHTDFFRLVFLLLITSMAIINCQKKRTDLENTCYLLPFVLCCGDIGFKIVTTILLYLLSTFTYITGLHYPYNITVCSIFFLILGILTGLFLYRLPLLYRKLSTFIEDVID